MIAKTIRPIGILLAASALALGVASPAAAQYRNKISNDMSRCRGAGPAVMVTVDGVKASTGRVRAQVYRATEGDWLKKGRWLNRVEAPAKAGSMSFCLPVPANGSYAVAVRHDLDGDGETDLLGDGGAMSNNPSINIFNLGKPSVSKTGFAVNGVKSIRIAMRYR
ncbi:DUF2141 domain-containing protein [Tsuneonella amylolytica]|uniref:DUF2141 domain-containing protein n=1 Tax=Tsuneonella amylolytica TaxID=2338327 RepID=UPI000EA85952|nr:DUF2141 domain-containing protein [Tsuneonella amylolytica]